MTTGLAVPRSSQLGFPMLIAALAVMVALLVPAVARAQRTDRQEQEEEEKGQKGGLRFRFRRRPSIRFGKVARVDFRVKFQGDFRGYSPPLRTKEGLFDLHRMRFGVEGRLFKDFEFEVERETRAEFSSLFAVDRTETQTPWRDVFVNFRHFRDFQIRGGRFKVPFSLDQLTGPSKLDFIQRSRIADLLAPGRDLGIVAHGRFFKRGLNYEAGIFERDGENARGGQVEGSERTFAGRITGTPLRLLPVPKPLRQFELGAAFTESALPEGNKGLRGRSISHHNIFPDFDRGLRMFVHGHRRRIGLESNWEPGPFSLKGEFIDVNDGRKGQGLRGEDLPNLIYRGWYVSGTWAVTGEKKAAGLDKPRRDFLLERGLGAVELAARWEAIRFGSTEHPGRPQRHQRAPNVLSQSDRIWTFGVNWYWNRYVKIQANAAREVIEDTQRAPISGRERFWTRLVRIQFVM